MLKFNDLNPTIAVSYIGFEPPIGPTSSLYAYDTMK